MGSAKGGGRTIPSSAEKTIFPFPFILVSDTFSSTVGSGTPPRGGGAPRRTIQPPPVSLRGGEVLGGREGSLGATPV